MFESINWAALSFVISAIALLANAATWIWVQVQNKHKATDQDIKTLDGRMTVVEQQLKALPTAEVWSGIRVSLAEISGDVKASAKEIHGLGAGLKRVEGQVAMLMENELKGMRP